MENSRRWWTGLFLITKQNAFSRSWQGHNHLKEVPHADSHRCRPRMRLDETDFESCARAKRPARSTESLSSLDLGILSFLPSAFRAADAALGVCESEWHTGIPVLNADRWDARDCSRRSSHRSDRHRRPSNRRDRA